MISLSVVHWLLASAAGLSTKDPASFPIRSSARSALSEFYVKARPDYSGRVTVPVLWDKQTSTIVNNESSEIIRMFNSAFDGVGAAEGDYYPSDLRAEIDALNARIYRDRQQRRLSRRIRDHAGSLRGGVPRAVRDARRLEARLAGQRFLFGERLTEADWRLFTTLIRFDPVYFGHFKCNLREIRDYPALQPLSARALPLAKGRRDGRLLPYQAPLLREPPAHQPDRHRAAGTGVERCKT